MFPNSVLDDAYVQDIELERVNGAPPSNPTSGDETRNLGDEGHAGQTSLGQHQLEHTPNGVPKNDEPDPEHLESRQHKLEHTPNGVLNRDEPDSEHLESWTKHDFQLKEEVVSMQENFAARCGSLVRLIERQDRRIIKLITENRELRVRVSQLEVADATNKNEEVPVASDPTEMIVVPVHHCPEPALMSGTRQSRRVSRRLHDAFKIYERSKTLLEKNLAGEAVTVNRRNLVQRLKLELELVRMCKRLCLFLLYFVPFAMFVFLIRRPAQVGNANSNLRSHFGIQPSMLAEISTWDQVYGFMQTFTEANDLLQATGYTYWCDPRFLDALGVTPAGKFEYLRQAELSNAHRRLQSSVSLLDLKLAYQNPTPLGTDAKGHAMNLYDCSHPSNARLLWSYHALQDAMRNDSNDSETNTTRTYLASETGPKAEYLQYFKDDFENFTNYNVKLHEYENASHPNTSMYLPRYRYPYKQISVMRPLIYQHRLKAEACKGGTFSDVYAHQSWNPDGPYGMNAPRATDILDCAGEILDDDVALDIDTKGYHFQDKTVYGRFAHQSGDHTGRNYDDWRRIGWMDKLTSKVTISAIVYTQAIELFSLVSVDFEQEAGGNIHATLKLDSVFDLSHGRGHSVIGCGIFGACMAFVAILQTARSLIRLITDESELEISPKRMAAFHSKLLHEIFELVSKFSLFSYLVAYMIYLSQAEPIQEECESLLNTFLNLDDFSHTGLQYGIQRTFELKETFDAHVGTEHLFGIIAIFVFIIQTCQLLLYVSSHPRLGILMDTLTRTMDDMIHFCLLFAGMYGMLGFIGHISFGATCPNEFGTILRAMKKQFEMLCGYGDDWPWRAFDNMDGLESLMFQIYLGLYVLLVFFIMLNFFIGIVLQGFFDCKNDVEFMTAENGFLSDIIDVGWSARTFRKHEWPRRDELIKKVQAKSDPKITPEMILEECEFSGDAAALSFLTYYCSKKPELIEE